MLKILLMVCCIGMFATNASGAEAKATDEVGRPDGADVHPDREFMRSNTNAVSWRSLDRWSFQGGVAFITESAIDEIGTLGGELADGKAGGQIYLVQVSYKLAELNPRLLLHRVELDVELPLVLGVVDENGRQPFMQYSGGVALRWKNFPWNKWLYTNLETGIGLTYSQRVLETERKRHPDRERSHLEFYWPVQLMLALPQHRQHQLVLFLHHHSGGGMFHRGGANSLGFGYRYVPGERFKETQ